MSKNKFFNTESMTAIVLSFVGGILDIYCLFNFDFYATMHTGNIIKMVENLIDGKIELFIDTILFILFFIEGLFITNFLEKKTRFNGIKISLVISLIFFTVIALIPNDDPPGDLSVAKMFSACVCGYEGALLIHSFTRFGKYSYSSTAMTSNMNRAVSNVYDRIATKDKTLNYGIVVYALIFIFFVLGVTGGYAYMKLVPFPVSGFWNLYKFNLLLIVPIVLICILLLSLKIKKTNKEKTESEEPKA